MLYLSEPGFSDSMLTMTGGSQNNESWPVMASRFPQIEWQTSCASNTAASDL